MSTRQMLVIEVSKIPLEGLHVAAPLDAAQVHVEGEPTFRLRPGAALDCHVERGDGHSVHVRGHWRAGLELSCGRCLEPFGRELDQELDLFYLPHSPDDPAEAEDEVELSDRDMVVAYYQGDRLDLGDVLREQLFLAVPLAPLCAESCRGLCPQCGANRNLRACECAAPAADPRLAGLANWLQKGPR